MLPVVEVGFESVGRAGDLVVRWQALVVGLGVLVALLGAAWLSRVAMARRGDGDPLRLDDLLYVTLGILPGAVLGARLFHALAYLDVYGGQPSLLLDTSRGGFSLTGAVLGGAATGWYVASLLEDTARRWAGVAAAPMLLALGIGKAGQFSAGGGQGAFWDGPWAVAFSGPGPWLSATPGVAAHPVALYEAIWYLAGVGLAVWGGRWLRGSGVVGEGAAFLVALCWFLAGRVVLGTFWRDDRLVGPLNAEQALAILALGVIVVVMSSVRLRRRGRMRAAERAGLVPPVNRDG